MQTIIDALPYPKEKKSPFIFTMAASALSAVPFHQDTKSIRRYFSEKFPVHIAVHEVSPVIFPPEEYTQLHKHHDHDEINIIISPHNLVYKICLDDEQYTVTNNSCIWIPRGMMHPANVLKGSGYFIAMRLD